MKYKEFFEIPLREGFVKTSTLKEMAEILENNKDNYAFAYKSGELLVVRTVHNKEDEKDKFMETSA